MLSCLWDDIVSTENFMREQREGGYLETKFSKRWKRMGLRAQVHGLVSVRGRKIHL